MTYSLARGVLEGRDYDPTRDLRHREARAAREQADWLAWCELGGLRPRTLVDYEWATAVLLRLYPSKTFEEFTDADIAHALRTFPAASRHSRRAPFTNWFDWGKRTRRRPDNPMDYLPRSRKPHSKPVETFSEEEVEIAILAAAPVDRPLVRILFECGLRKGEARVLRLRDCDFRQATMRVRGKGGKERVLPMSDQLCQELAQLELDGEFAKGDYLWYCVHANAVSRQRDRRHPVGNGTFARWWQVQLEWAGVKYRKPHAARHTFATNWRRRGLGLDEIQLLLGHTSIQTTSDLYVHTDIRDVAARMAEIIAKVKQ